MKKNGFTLVEVLAVLIILALLMVLAIPAFMGIYTGIRRDSYNNKVEVVEKAMMSYGYKIKDEIKYQYDLNKGTNAGCLTYEIDGLIELGYLESEEDTRNVLINPTDNTVMSYPIYACYCPKKYDIQAYYAQEFDSNKTYYKDEKVMYNGSIYVALRTYPDPPKSEVSKSGDKYISIQDGINSKYNVLGTTGKDESYFQKIEC